MLNVRSPACPGVTTGRKMPGWLTPARPNTSSGLSPPLKRTLTLPAVTARKSASVVR